MNWKQYQNELIVVFSILAMLGAYVYKHNKMDTERSNIKTMTHAVEEIKEVLLLKKTWANKKIITKIQKLEELIPKPKRIWKKEKRKVTASYRELSAKQLNQLITKILNIPIVIRQLEVKNMGETYSVEFKCKW